MHVNFGEGDARGGHCDGHSQELCVRARRLVEVEVAQGVEEDERRYDQRHAHGHSEQVGQHQGQDHDARVGSDLSQGRGREGDVQVHHDHQVIEA